MDSTKLLKSLHITYSIPFTQFYAQSHYQNFKIPFITVKLDITDPKRFMECIGNFCMPRYPNKTYTSFKFV